MKKICCAISIDMDPLWHYLNARGFQPLQATHLNAVYDDALPRFLDLFDEYGVKATFFLVGKDAGRRENNTYIQDIIKRGHEIANHTYSHLQNFKTLSFEEKRGEIEEAHKVLSDVCGTQVLGFRAPGWGIDADVMGLLEDLGYTYDSSVFPSLITTPISLVNWIMNRGRLSQGIGGSLNVGLAPKTPYRPHREKIWRRGDMGLMELPPSILPIIQLPFLGTLLYLWGRKVFTLSYHYLRLFRRPMLYELHGIEMVDYYRSVQDDRLKVKPGLLKTMEEKLDLYRFMLSTFQKHSVFMTMKDLAALYDEGDEPGSPHTPKG